MIREIQSGDQRKRSTAYFDIELDDAGLDPYAFRAYCRIARRAAGHDGGACTESVENMATNCGMSRPTMVRALACLIRRRMIQRIQRHGYTSVYVLLDKSQWNSDAPEQGKSDSINEGDGKPQNRLLGKGENHPLVNEGTTPGKPQNHPLVNHRTTKKTNKEYKKEKSIGANAPAPEKSFHHHPAVNAYRVELGYKQINSTQATFIAEKVGGDGINCPATWLAFLRDLAATGFKHVHNVKATVLAYGHWCMGQTRAQAIDLAFKEINGNGAAGVAPIHKKRDVVV